MLFDKQFMRDLKTCHWFQISNYNYIKFWENNLSLLTLNIILHYLKANKFI